jgi:tetratricopeptide (TPR) repeat protein
MAPRDVSSTFIWSGRQAYVLAIVCLGLGVAVGYLVRGSAPPMPQQEPVQQQQVTTPAGGQVTPQQLKHMAEQQAKPLLAELKQKPNDPALLTKLGNVYYDAQLYPEAINYYQRSLAVHENAQVRTDMGSAEWYLGNGDAAIRDYETALKSNPRHANAWFNLGMVKWQSNRDAAGAVAAWQQLLNTNPDLPRRAEVEELIARARQHAGMNANSKARKPAL